MQAGSGAHQKPGTRIPGKKRVISAGIIIAGIIIVAIAASIIFQSPENRENPVSPTATSPASPAPRHAPAVTETQRNPVDFLLLPGEQTSCGLTCRQLSATITNTGYETAHNVCITVALHNSRNEVISLNGEASLRRCVGDIAGGESRTEPITVNADCGFFASKCIQETLTLQTRVISDEKTVQFPDQVIAV